MINFIVAQIRNSFKYFDTKTVKLLFVALVRPHLEFASPVWNPLLGKNIDKLESIQHKVIYFLRDTGEIFTSRDNYFLNRVIPLWNKLPLKAMSVVRSQNMSMQKWSLGPNKKPIL